jgi:hypothetical protein
VLGAIPKKGNKEYGSQGGTIPSLPPDIDKKTSHYAQQLARHPEAIKQAVALACDAPACPVFRPLPPRCDFPRRTAH